jgi:L-tyrosine isonitrile synthase
MSDYEVLTASDTTSRPVSEERSVSELVLQSASYRNGGSIGETARDSGRALANRSLKKPAPKVSPENILRAFNTWAFKREHPSDPQLTLRVIAEAISHNQPIPFVAYWGKGPRCDIDEHDLKCVDYLAAFASRISAAYAPGALMKLIFTDTHARLNGYTDLGIRTYTGAVEIEAHQRGFETCTLSQLIQTTQAKAEDYLDDNVPQDMLEKLCASAMKWYHGPDSVERGAVTYFHMNMIEKRAVELSFPKAIFATFNSSKFRILFPKRMPIFYMYSMQRGMSVKPWFLPADASVCTDTNCQCKARNSQSADRS